jgi:hypothetical protein
MISTKRIVGSVDGDQHEVKFNDPFITLWGNYKKNSVNPIDTTVFKIISAGANQAEFLMETGNPSIAFVYGIKTVEGFYRANSKITS